MTKRIVLCADDYGQDEAVSRGILELLAGQRLTAVSCMVNQPGWAVQSAWLLPYQTQADIGLHLNFSEGAPLSALYRDTMGERFMPLSGLLRRTVLRSRLIKLEAVTAEIHAQLDQFEAAMGCLPRFIDGHQHVHHLPVISDALLAVFRERLQGEHVYVRAVTQPGRWYDIFVSGLKNAVIHCTGGADFAARLDHEGIAHNTSFAGIYAFSHAARYREYFQEFLQESTDHGLIMCHPGLPSTTGHDAISQARQLEYEYFKGNEFISDCERYGVVMTRF